MPITSIPVAWVGNLFLGWGLALVLATVIVRHTNGTAAGTIRRMVRQGRHGVWLSLLVAVGMARWGLNPLHPSWIQEAAFGVFLALLTPQLLRWLMADNLIHAGEPEQHRP